jgi:hypothetical protein
MRPTRALAADGVTAVEKTKFEGHKLSADKVELQLLVLLSSGWLAREAKSL